MDERRHSIDVPITRTLVALRRVRSLRDPSTNSMSKFSAFVDSFNWETNSTDAITLGFEKGCKDGLVDNNILRLKESRLNGENEHHTTDNGFYYGSRKSDSRLGPLVGNTGTTPLGNFYIQGSNEFPLVKELACKNEVLCNGDRGDHGAKEFELMCIEPSNDCLEGVGSSNETKEGFIGAETASHSRSKRKGRYRKHTQSSRKAACDIFTRAGSPGLSVNGTLEGSNRSLSFSDYENLDVVDSCHQGCGISSCWTRTPRFRQSNLFPDAEEQPLLSEDASETMLIRQKTCWKFNSNGVILYTDNPNSLSQKFRPKSFNELVGQSVVVSSLLSAIANAQLTSFYIFHGPRGTGKTSASRIFAAAVNCLSPKKDKPCGLCQECALFFCGRSRDVKLVDSLQINKSGRIRSLIKNAELPPVSSRFKVYIIDECHLLRGETWVTFLNNLKDISRYVIFIMITPDLDKLPQNAVLQSHKHHFLKVKEADIVKRLEKISVEEGFDFDHDALNLIAMKSNGSLWDAETMLEQLSLLGKKITKSLVYELIGIVSDDELLDLLHLALSSDTSNTVKRARELMRSRIDPMQLISQLANLIVDILAGKCPEGISDVNRKLFGRNISEADMQQFSHALKILSETEKQLRISKNQTTWLTVALLQLSSVGCSIDSNDSEFYMRPLQPQDSELYNTSSTGESLKHLVTCTCHNSESEKMGMRVGEETLQLMWRRASEMCGSNSLKKFLRKRGKLTSLSHNQGVAVAELEFCRPDYVSKAEKSWKSIAGALQCTLGCNVEIRVNLVPNASRKYGKLRRIPHYLFSCSRRVFCKSHFLADRSNIGSENSDSTSKRAITIDKCVETCTPEYGFQISNMCNGVEALQTMRNIDGNALSIGVSSSHRSLPDDKGRRSQSGTEEGHNCRCRDLISLRHDNQPECLCRFRKSNSLNASQISSSQLESNLALSCPSKTSSETCILCCDPSFSCLRQNGEIL